METTQANIQDIQNGANSIQLGELREMTPEELAEEAARTFGSRMSVTLMSIGAILIAMAILGYLPLMKSVIAFVWLLFIGVIELALCLTNRSEFQSKENA